MTAPFTLGQDRPKRNPFADLVQKERDGQRANPFADLADAERAIELPAGIPDPKGEQIIRPSRSIGETGVSHKTAEPYEVPASTFVHQPVVVSQRPPLHQRVWQAVTGVAKEVRDDPAGTIGRMTADLALAPGRSLAESVFAPGVGDARPDPELVRARFGGPRKTESSAAPYDVEHGAVTPTQRRNASLQTLANVFAMGAGPKLAAQLAAAGATGAAYDTEDPERGALLAAAFVAAPRTGAAATRPIGKYVRRTVSPDFGEGMVESAARDIGRASQGTAPPDFSDGRLVDRFIADLERGAVDAGTAQPRGVHPGPEPLSPAAREVSDFMGLLTGRDGSARPAKTPPIEGIEHPSDVVARQAAIKSKGIQRRPKAEMPAVSEGAAAAPDVASSPTLQQLARELESESPHEVQPGTEERFPEGFTMGDPESRIPAAEELPKRASGSDAPSVHADRATADAIVEGEPLAVRAAGTDGDRPPLPEPLERRLQEMQSELDKAVEARNTAQREAETDKLTGVANRAALDRALPAAEADPATSVVVFDANDFGQVNKRVSQEAGDRAIQDVASAIRQAAEEHGIGERVFRRGGDEFVVLAPDALAESVRSRAEQIFGERTFGTGEKGVKVSLSGTHARTFADADASLQAAKQARKVAAGATSTGGNPAPREYINWRTWGERPEILSRIQQRAEELRASGQLEKGRVSFDEQRQLGHEFAKELLADPLRIDRAKLSKLKGHEIVALKEVVQENTAIIESASRALNSGELSPAEIQDATRALDGARKATDEALATIVRESAEAGRTLGGLRQMARQTLDPDAWIVHAKRLYGDRPLPDSVMLEVRKLAQTAANACRGGS
jgi:diguanylate cyclase (GGDEF)-like protein